MYKNTVLYIYVKNKQTFTFYSKRHYIAKYIFDSEQISKVTDTGKKEETKKVWLLGNNNWEWGNYKNY